MFRILALDGGGINGTFTAAVLKYFEAELDGPIADHFDLIVGTSTGGMIALGLGCGMEASRILELYKEEGQRIFPPGKRRFSAFIERIFGPKFDSDDLREVLLNYYPPNLRFMELEHRIAITSFDATSAHPVVFKTNYHPSLTANAHAGLSVVDVALATSAAPTYFKAAKTGSGVMIDGGVWANCPAMVGITEAMSLFRRKIDDICVLNIGTTSIPMFVRKGAREGGLLQWVGPISSLLMHASKLGVIEQAKKLCQEFVRVDEFVDPDRFEMDDASQVDELETLGRKQGAREWNRVREIFFAPRRKSKSKVGGRVKTVGRR
jgi:patatin-like phospholipase/acyl hydrolase